MKVYKFGGASVNSADAVRNMADIVRKHMESEPLVVVVSAMGKTTNLLERLVPGASAKGESEALREQLEKYHRDIANNLIPNNEAVQQVISRWLASMDHTIERLQGSADRYNYNYDQVVCHGELLSTSIISHYLNHLGIRTKWVDAREIVSTDNHFREGKVNWEKTQCNVDALVADFMDFDVILTQGFIGGTADGSTTTLGREGSDYSASILAYCLNAENITIWKDVPGFLNADPKYFKDTVKIQQIPYNEAIELAYYGASVIHPKTVKPIQNKGIPLFIRSFITPDCEGSSIGDYRTILPETPLYIFKNNQILISIFPKDFSFIAEDNLQIIFGILSELGIRVNMMQNSALSFSICIDNNAQLTSMLVDRLQRSFHVRYNENLQLVTIRYYNQAVIDSIVAGRPILLEQRSRSTEQLIVPTKG